MNLIHLEVLFKSLNDIGSRYLIAGGLAVVAHGYLRFTADIDLIVDLESANLEKTLQAFASRGYRPRAPVSIMDFLDETKRSEWIKDKNLKVFSIWTPNVPAFEIDLFVVPLFPFETLYAERQLFEAVPGLWLSVVSLEHLILMKSLAGRPKDIEDIKMLKKIQDYAHDP